jgi:hypothetical protein
MMKQVVSVALGLCVSVAHAFTTDVEVVERNLGLTSCVWNAETLLSPSLSLNPPRKTVVAGSEILFTASENTNPVSWFMTDNRSGSALEASGVQTALYAAGPTSDCVDVVEVWDGINSFGRGYVNVISSEEVARCGRAIVVAGRVSATDALWGTTKYLANLGYRSLLYRGYSKDNMKYLSPVTGYDVDGDGLDNDIAGASTVANLAYTITNWVGNADKLFVYLVDHGEVSGDMGIFKINPEEDLTAEQLDTWLDSLQNRYTNDVVVVIDCCYSGSFLHSLDYQGPAKRIVITSCAADQVTYFLSGGLVSFSEALFAGLMNGLSLGDAYAAAKAAMADADYQMAQLDDNGDGLSNASDGAVAEDITVGASFVAGKDAPQIGLVLGNQQLTGDTVATLWASDVSAAYPIARVWCLVMPPNYQPDPVNPVMDLPQLELTYNPNTGRYEAQYAGFSEEGVYKIIYYAKDIWESVSMPKQSYVVQSGFLERALIVAGGKTSDIKWPIINQIAGQACRALQDRRLDTNAIYYLSQTQGNFVDGLTSRGNLMNAITNWAKGSNKLTLYMVATSASPEGDFILNGTEKISPSEIDGLLDGYQVSNSTVTVVMDFSASGDWLPVLAAPTRTCISSTKESCVAAFKEEAGILSFSSLFFGFIGKGFNVWDAFENASRLIKRPSGVNQKPQLDSTADGRYDVGLDKIVPLKLFLGSAFMTGADAPSIDAVTPDTVLSDPGSLTLWASGVADIGVSGISNVFCVVTGPGTEQVADLPDLELVWNPVTERHEVLYSGFEQGGTYACTYFVTDNDGQLSLPLQTLVEVTSGDGYEPDDTSAQAGFIDLGVAQTHNLHVFNDEDWVKFYAPSGYVFNIQASQLGTNSDLYMEVYYEEVDGSLTFVDESNWDDQSDGDEGVEYVEIDLKGPYQDPAGFYYVRIFSAINTLWGEGSEYELVVFPPTGAPGNSLIVVAVDKMNPFLPPLEAVVLWDGTNSRAFDPSNNSTMLEDLAEGVHTVQVSVANGYLLEQDPAQPEQVYNPESYYGNPKKAVSVIDSPRIVIFQFVPVTTVRGKVVDRLTGEPVVGASVAFEAVGGPLNGLIYDGYPNSAVYESPWVTDLDGSFPTNVWLPKSQWSLTVSRSSYTNLVRNPAVEQEPAGVVTNLGTLLLSPLDLNENGVADDWEAQYGLTNVTAGSDADSDTFPDRSEYLAGTDPTNSLSVFQILEMIKSPAADCSMRWNAIGRRSYRIYWSETPGTWPVEQSTLVGPTNAWCDSEEPKPAMRFYRVNVELP